MPRAPALLLALALAAAPAPSLAGDGAGGKDEVRDLGPILAKIVDEHGVPGIAAAIVEGAEKGARLTALGAAGVRARGSEEKVLPADRFHLGSCTKAMTATLCAMLVEEGKLSFDLAAAKALADPSKADPGWKGAALEHLLTMRAGAPESLDAGGLWAALWRREGTTTDQRALLCRGVLGKPPVDPPGTKTVYANASFAIAGHLAERAAGKAFEDLLRERLFVPLGMEGAGFGAPGTADAVDQPRGHGADGKPVPPGPAADNPPGIAPAGTVHATLADWARFAALHLDGPRGRTRLLKKESFLRLHAPAGERKGDGYAMGWQVTARPWGGRVLTHSGSNTMWFCTAWLAPDARFCVLVTCNQGDASKACDAVAGACIRRYRPASK